MYWGDFAGEIRKAEQKEFKAPRFSVYKKPITKYVYKEINGPVLNGRPCNDCPFDKATMKQCKRCRGN